MKKVIDLTDKIYNGIKIIERDFEREKQQKEKGKNYSRIYWKCICHCGKEFSAVGTNLKSGNTKSCGCLQKKSMSKVGKGNSRENVWIFQDNVAIGVINERKRFYIDIEDYKKVKTYKWRMDRYGYIVANSKDCTNTIVKIHKIIMNPPNDKLVDHKDGDKTNNKKSNLRICTKSQNNMNIKKKKNNTSGFTGVKWNKRQSKWTSQINVNNKRIHLGTFNKFEEAVEARKIANKKYHGEYSGSIRRGEE